MASLAVLRVWVFVAALILRSPAAFSRSLRSTRTKVQQNMDYKLASDHNIRVGREAPCEAPSPRLLRVDRLLNEKESRKTFLPHSTILHRCADDGGYCSDGGKSCVPVEEQAVVLYFFVTWFEGPRRHKSGVEKHVFTNHTQCGCRQRTSLVAVNQV